MLLVIMGAGASYDAAPDSPPGATDTLRQHRLPLANELFAQRGHFRAILAGYPEIAPAVAHLIKIPKDRSIEDFLEHMAAQARNGDAARARQLLAIRFYLSEVMRMCESQLLDQVRGVTNHAALIDEIDRRVPIGETVFIVTFNYDRLIERELSSDLKLFSDMNAYIQNERFKIVKLHGSADWVRPLKVRPMFDEKTVPRRQLIAMAPTLSISDEFVHTQQPHQGDYCVPAIAIPIRHKDDFQCPPAHVDALMNFLPSVTKILIVGWKAAEQPFVDLLVKHIPQHSTQAQNPHIVVVGGEDVAITKMNLDAAGVLASQYSLNNLGFTHFTQSIYRDPAFETFMRK
jgi:hypothetical protein